MEETHNHGGDATTMMKHHPGVDTDKLPQGFPLWKKLHATVASWLGVFTLVYAATVATPVILKLPMALDTTQTLANFAYSAPFLGVFFAPLFTPHISEVVGRKPVYVGSLSLFLIFLGAISQAKTIEQLIVLRVFAGLFGGPIAVLIEGTHADVWPASRTNSYYCSIALSQYWGAAFGPIIGAQALAYGGVPWLAYSALIIGGAAWLLVVTMPETYERQIVRRERKKNPDIPELEPASSGTVFKEMIQVTVLTPMTLIAEPLVLMGGLLVGLSFAVVFQFFVTVPFVLDHVYGVTSAMPFFAAVAGSALSFFTSMIVDLMVNPGEKIEKRLMPAMLGVFLTVIGLFWVAWTAKPSMPYIIPVTGTAVYVWGNMSILLSVISYFFDAYNNAGILSALTAMACFRLACALIVPIFILDMFAGLTPPWALSTFGFIGVAFIPFPFIMFFYGERLRSKSRILHIDDNDVSPVFRHEDKYAYSP